MHAVYDPEAGMSVISVELSERSGEIYYRVNLSCHLLEDQDYFHKQRTPPIALEFLSRSSVAESTLACLRLLLYASHGTFFKYYYSI